MMSQSGKNIQAMEFALQMCIDKISNALSLASYETYENGKQIFGTMWWQFNYEPNQNNSQNSLIAGIVREMVKNDDGALVIQKNNEFILAESFTVVYRAYKPNIYKNIVLAGGLAIHEVFLEEDVLHYTINDSKIKHYLDVLYGEYEQLISGAIRNYNRGNALKLGLKIGTLFDQQFGKKMVGQDEEGNDVSEADVILDEMYENRFSAVLSDKDSITPLEEGLEFSNLVSTAGNTKSGAVTTRDIYDTFLDVIHFAADSFSIPRGIMTGDVADAEAIRENFVNFAVRPFADAIETENNRKLYGMANVANGTKFKIQTNTILIYSAEKFASAAEALFRIGGYNPNEIRSKLGEERINKPWADEYYVSLNYARADSSGNANQTTDSDSS